MAIDSAEKRRAAVGVPFFLLGPGVTPNASKDEAWRRQAGWSYSGLIGIIGGGVGGMSAWLRRRRRR